MTRINKTFGTTHRVVVLVAGTVLLGACYPKFRVPPNQTLPKALATRAQLQNYATYQDHLEDLVGHVLYVTKKSGKCPDLDKRIFDAIDVSRRAYLKSSEKLKPKALSRHMYEAKLERGTAHAAKFGFGTVDFGASQAVEFIVTDTMELSAGDQLDNDELDKIAETPLPHDVCARFVIRGAILSVVSYRVYSKLQTKYDISGNAFGVGGNVYASTNQVQTQFILGLELGTLRKERVSRAVEALIKRVVEPSRAMSPATFEPFILVGPGGDRPFKVRD